MFGSYLVRLLQNVDTLHKFTKYPKGQPKILNNGLFILFVGSVYFNIKGTENLASYGNTIQKNKSNDQSLVSARNGTRLTLFCGRHQNVVNPFGNLHGVMVDLDGTLNALQCQGEIYHFVEDLHIITSVQSIPYIFQLG